jgi:hypothetical protein
MLTPVTGLNWRVPALYVSPTLMQCAVPRNLVANMRFVVRCGESQ